MRIPKVLMFAIPALLLYCGCATNGTEREEQKRAAKVNESSDWHPAGSGEYQLAVEVEVRQDGITPLGATVVQAPPKTHSAIQDLMVTATGAERSLQEYAMADPRLAEVDREGTRVLDTARTFVFAPLSAELTSISVRPLSPANERVSRGGTFDARPLLRSACEKEREIQPCQQILRAFPQ